MKMCEHIIKKTKAWRIPELFKESTLLKNSFSKKLAATKATKRLIIKSKQENQKLHNEI